jgi:hypothetical protein
MEVTEQDFSHLSMPDTDPMFILLILIELLN